MQKQLYKILFELAPLGILLINHDGKVIVRNDFIVQRLAAHNIHDLYLYDLVSKENWNLIKLEIDKCIPGINQINDIHCQVNDVYYQVSLIRINTLFTDYQDEFSRYFLLTFNDITKIKQADNELIAYNKELKEFSYIMAHDLKSPLRTIKIFSQFILNESRFNNELNDYFYNIIAAINSMEKLLNSLLQYLRLNINNIKMSPVMLKSIIELALINTNNVHNPNIIINFDNNDYCILGNGSLLTGVFQNLIDNALKFQSQNNTPKIFIQVSSWNDSYIRVQVIDNGIGIAEEDYNKIFQIFQRLHSESDYPGSGIGLSICQKIIKLHGSSIDLESKINHGSIFGFLLKRY